MSKSILLADDSVTIRKVVELTFMDEDYELDSVGSGEEALERLASETPDLVIADVHMSGVSGYDVCRQVKDGASAPPVLLLVGTFEPFDPADVEKSGADRFLKKPFDSQELLHTVRELLAGAESADEDESGGEAESVREPAPSKPPVDQKIPEASAAAGLAAPVEVAASEAEQEAAPHDRVDASELPVVAEPAEQVAAPPAPELSDEAVDRIARRVAELLADKAVRDVAWEVVPDLAEVVIKERLRELESQVE